MKFDEYNSYSELVLNHPYQKILDNFKKRYAHKSKIGVFEDLKFGAEAAYLDFVKYRKLKCDYMRQLGKFTALDNTQTIQTNFITLGDHHDHK